MTYFEQAFCLLYSNVVMNDCVQPLQYVRYLQRLPHCQTCGELPDTFPMQFCVPESLRKCGCKYSATKILNISFDNNSAHRGKNKAYGGDAANWQPSRLHVPQEG